MPWIEGIGDEVPIFFFLAVAVVVLFMVLAWKSTDVPEPSTPPSEDHLRFSVTADATPEVPADLSAEHPSPPVNLSPEPQPSTTSSEPPPSTQENKETITNNTESEQVASTTDEPEDDTGSKIRRRILETTRAHVILIRLKYLDDSQRTVESNGNTTLGEFRREHFNTELSANKTVRLIYNGQVLSGESQTLTQLGLDNNCVVHCLIHQSRSNTTASQQPINSEARPSVNQGAPQPPRESSTAEAGVDIGGLLLPLFGVILGLVWYCRIAYATHFTAAATTILVGLSGLCILSVFVVWHPTLAADPTS